MSGAEQVGTLLVGTFVSSGPIDTELKLPTILRVCQPAYRRRLAGVSRESLAGLDAARYDGFDFRGPT
jgi:hypothetical protein